MQKRLLFLCGIGALLCCVAVWWQPVNDTKTRLVFLAGLFAMPIVFAALIWEIKWLRVGLLVIPLIVFLPFLLPQSDYDQRALHRNYMANLISYEGADYFWGGENSRGIDCSGLPRRAFRDALLSNFQFRGWAKQWLNDASALALSQGYRDYMKPLGIEGTIQSLDCSGLEAGDLAITKNGVHVIVYLGENRWIQADPGAQKVRTQNGRKDENPWFKTPVEMYRWSELAN